MSKKDKIRVVWVCNFSDHDVREHVKVHKYYYAKILSFFFHKPFVRWNDYGAWVTNGLREFEKLNNQVELHVIFPYYGQKGKIQHFNIRGIHYHSFRSEDDSFFSFFLNRIIMSRGTRYEKNALLISSLVNKIDPDIVHYIGIENLIYSTSVFKIPSKYPIIAQLQTLLSDPEIAQNYPQYIPIVEIEKRIINRVDYIGTKVQHFIKIIKEEINPTANIVGMNLAVRETINTPAESFSYDFVYFSADIKKAVDLAIEAFAILQKQYPNTTLDVVGGYTPDYMKELECRIEELGIKRNVYFEGSLPTHEAVINQIRKARFALLPLKTDMVSSTIREALSNGIPVVTTITPGTPKLNEKRLCVLLSETGDHDGLAQNMVKLITNSALASELSNNGLLYSEERDSNYQMMLEIVEIYKSIMGGKSEKRTD